MWTSLLPLALFVSVIGASRLQNYPSLVPEPRDSIDRSLDGSSLSFAQVLPLNGSGMIQVTENCDPSAWVRDLVLDERPGFFTGKLRQKATTECDNIEGHLRGHCSKGVLIGNALCKQSKNISAEVPEEMISLVPRTKAWRIFKDKWCSISNLGNQTWTNFKHCHQACQYVNLQGASPGRIGGGTMLVSMFNACVHGCAAYVNLKSSEKGGGPNCVVGEPIPVILPTEEDLHASAQLRCLEMGGGWVPSFGAGDYLQLRKTWNQHSRETYAKHVVRVDGMQACQCPDAVQGCPEQCLGPYMIRRLREAVVPSEQAFYNELGPSSARQIKMLEAKAPHTIRMSSEQCEPCKCG